eukprot:COSAG01_NODE_33648_length_561_cov_0.640693_2_plen_76_part_00
MSYLMRSAANPAPVLLRLISQVTFRARSATFIPDSVAVFANPSKFYDNTAISRRPPDTLVDGAPTLKESALIHEL